MSMIKALRTLAAIENGTLNAAALQAQVAGSQARKDEISQLLSVKSLHARIVASRTAMDALAGSAAAWAEIAAHRYFSTFMSECVESVNAKMALFNNDPALSAIAVSPAAMAVMRAASKYSVVTNTANGVSAVSLALQLSGAAYIVLGASHTGSAVSYNYTMSTKRSGSAVSATVASGATTNILGKDVACAIPITPTYSFTSVSGNVNQAYFGVLRCDI